jgi:hypothetical protein
MLIKHQEGRDDNRLYPCYDGNLALSLSRSLPQPSLRAKSGKRRRLSLRDKGYDPGDDGQLGPKRDGRFGQYQKAENLPVTEHRERDVLNTPRILPPEILRAV